MRILIAFLCVCFSTVGFAATDTAQNEIDYLLKHIEGSKALFIRSGKEYSAKDAADHLRTKLARAGGRVKTAEDFIAGIASKSYLNGSIYQIKMSDGSVQSAGPWLTEALARKRRTPAKE